MQRTPRPDNRHGFGYRSGVGLRAAQGHTIRVGEAVAHNIGDRPVTLTRLMLFDKPRILGKAAAVDDERLAAFVRQRTGGADVFQTHRLATARIVGDSDHHTRHAVAVILQIHLK